MDQDPMPTGQKEPQPSNSYLAYGSLAFQLFGGIGLAAWAGYKLDQYLVLRFPVFTLSFVLATFSGMLYQVYKKMKKD